MRRLHPPASWEKATYQMMMLEVAVRRTVKGEYRAPCLSLFVQRPGVSGDLPIATQFVTKENPAAGDPPGSWAAQGRKGWFRRGPARQS